LHNLYITPLGRFFKPSAAILFAFFYQMDSFNSMPKALLSYRGGTYASNPDSSLGRLYQEEEANTRSSFQRDRDRIIHSVAFRRLEYKTQVFVNHEGDHFRTRLTHSLEVAQLARSICRGLGLNEDLAEALALAHDLGHTPFGHAGEDALREVMEDYGGFDHNAQTIRIITKLEHRYAEFDGLNLTWETLEGIAKHNGPVAKPARALAEYNRKHDLELKSYPSAEAQIASLSDDIAYLNHDIDDGLRSKLLIIEEIETLPLIGEIMRGVRRKYPKIDHMRCTHESIRRMINRMVVDLTRQTQENVARYRVKSVEEVRALGKPLAHFSPEMQKAITQIKGFLMQKLYRHYRVNRMTSKARRMLKDLFLFFHSEPECLPDEWQQQIDKPGSTRSALIVADYIAGMTDRYAMEEYLRVFNMEARG